MSTPTDVQIVLDWQCEVDWPELPPDPDAWLSAIIAATVRRVGLAGIFEISLVITDDRRMLRINRQFRGIDKTTDVLSFPQSGTPLLALPRDQSWVAREMGDDTHDAPSDTRDLPADEATGAMAGTTGAINRAPTQIGGQNARATALPLSDGEGAGGVQAAPQEVTTRNGAAASPAQAGWGHPYHLGDIMISAPTVARQAAEAGHSAIWECAFLVAHGTLHLLGYDDYYETGYRAMVAHQHAVLAELGIKR